MLGLAAACAYTGPAGDADAVLPQSFRGASHTREPRQSRRWRRQRPDVGGWSAGQDLDSALTTGADRPTKWSRQSSSGSPKRSRSRARWSSATSSPSARPWPHRHPGNPAAGARRGRPKCFARRAAHASSGDGSPGNRVSTTPGRP